MGFDPDLEYKTSLPVISGPSMPVTFPTLPMPYVGYLPAGTWVAPSDTEDFEEVESRYWKKGRYCAKMEGFSCYPALQPGDFTMWEENPAPAVGKIVVAQRKGDHAATVKRLDWLNNEYALKAINAAESDAEADGWGVVAMLVLVSWIDQEGGEVTVYRPDGIRPSQLIAIRGHQT